MSRLVQNDHQMSDSEDELAKRKSTSRLTWIFVAIFSAALALFGKGGFSNVDSPIAHALERVLFLLGPVALVSALLAHILVGLRDIYPRK